MPPSRSVPPHGLGPQVTRLDGLGPIPGQQEMAYIVLWEKTTKPGALKRQFLKRQIYFFAQDTKLAFFSM